MLLPVVAIVAVVAVFGVDKVIDTVTGVFGGGGTEIIAEGEFSIMVSSADEKKVKSCQARQVIQQKQCNNLKVVVIDAKKMPYIGRGIREAWESGLPGLLIMNRANEDVNRAASCRSKRYQRNYQGTSCDEYPMAPTDEGGENAHVEEVPKRENLCQGGTVRWQYPKDGDKFLVVISNPGSIAPQSYVGVDIAKDQICPT
ncbi:NucA/NucB deoxyribonuclease domain-containing protein [Actinokineospora sp. NBRC 105648]|uniref:NucA/NucB deoxyribonuclease domain-containing protein n=1 Tax=Actinokineospora sp. NBRC 105648 TaxID=3032206 RepID=UPI002554FB25|nr:NucA/NucB deoxyribonuclease domain-containing protein [Actinokineospora sp. NBRC 105648]